MMQTYKKLLTVAILATIIVIAGTYTYFNYFAKRRLIISTTTSLYDTGLLDEIAYNFFTIVGPDADPAGVEGKTANAALRKIANYGGNLTDQLGQTKIWVS